MTVQATVPILFVQQMGPAGRLAHDLATHPEAAQNMSRQMSEALLRQESQQVQKLEESDQTGTIKDEEKRRNDARQQEQRRMAKEQEEPEEPVPSMEAPHLGLLVNRKI